MSKWETFKEISYDGYLALKTYAIQKFFQDLRKVPNDREWLIYQLEGAHIQANRDNERLLSELRAFSKFRWPKFEPAFILMLDVERRKLEEQAIQEDLEWEKAKQSKEMEGGL